MGSYVLAYLWILLEHLLGDPADAGLDSLPGGVEDLGVKVN